MSRRRKQQLAAAGGATRPRHRARRPPRRRQQQRQQPLDQRSRRADPHRHHRPARPRPPTDHRARARLPASAQQATRRTHATTSTRSHARGSTDHEQLRYLEPCAAAQDARRWRRCVRSGSIRRGSIRARSNSDRHRSRCDCTAMSLAPVGLPASQHGLSWAIAGWAGANGHQVDVRQGERPLVDRRSAMSTR